MKKHVLLYGIIAGVLVVLLRLIEYRYLVIEHSIEIYGGLVAAVFAGIGIWLGLRLTRGRTTAGPSTKEIAERVFVSENTVKTHSSRLFDKLGAKRRTQAVQLGKKRRLIP